MAVNPTTGDLWCSANERDGLENDLPPAYITRVRAGGFYCWPWYYIGAHLDPLHLGERPDLQNQVIVPDILIQQHSASLQMMFYTGAQFPAEYKVTSLRPSTVHGTERSAPAIRSFVPS